ncbi:MAG: Mov34/MPN/PAD-1 family protein [Planctomycetes bacterium]|nr:Mov34/MPN/PAD-1 family protein [Planctomycetota bacterium]
MPANGDGERQPGQQGLRDFARQLWGVLQRSLFRQRGAASPAVQEAPGLPKHYEPLCRVLLTDGVARTLFEEYAAHRAAERGDEETGWMLLGLRERDEAIALATLPAGTQRDAGIAHVRFNSSGQALASRIVRQADRRIIHLGVVHTHPGSLRHPSDGDFQGDSDWVQKHVRGREGVFGIGTADGPLLSSPVPRAAVFASRPRPNVQCLGELCFSWYSLRPGQSHYEPLPVELTIGPDLARSLHEVWPTLEEHAERLDRLYRQQAGVTCTVMEDARGPALAVNVPLAEAGDAIRVLLWPKEVRYYVLRGGEVFAVDCPADSVDRGVYLLMAELAAQV